MLLPCYKTTTVCVRACTALHCTAYFNYRLFIFIVLKVFDFPGYCGGRISQRGELEWREEATAGMGFLDARSYIYMPYLCLQRSSIAAAIMIATEWIPSFPPHQANRTTEYFVSFTMTSHSWNHANLTHTYSIVGSLCHNNKIIEESSWWKCVKISASAYNIFYPYRSCFYSFQSWRSGSGVSRMSDETCVALGDWGTRKTVPSPSASTTVSVQSLSVLLLLQELSNWTYEELLSK